MYAFFELQILNNKMKEVSIQPIFWEICSANQSARSYYSGSL